MLYEGHGFLRWGRHGRPHAYTVGDPTSRARAVTHAHEDGMRRSARWIDDGPKRLDAVASATRRGAVPTAEQVLYQGMLQQRVALVGRLVQSMVMPLLRDDPRMDSERHRADAVDPADLAKALGILRAIRFVVDDMGDKDKEGILYVGQELEETVSAFVDRQLSRLFTIPIATAAPSGLVTQWAEINAALITSIPAQYLDEIAALIEGGVRAGTPTARLRDEIKARYGVTTSRANLIARDQTAKLTSQIQRHRHQSYGIEEYMWSTSGDSRVRQVHANLDGRIFRYDAPPVADKKGNRGHPGELWQCRCTGRPIRPQDDVAALKAEAIARKEREAGILSRSPTVQGQIPNRSGFSDWNRSRLRELRAGGQRARQAVGL